MNIKLLFSASTTNQIKAHIRCFGYAMYNCARYDAIGENVVKFNWCWTLDMAYLMYGITKGHSIFAVDET